MIRKIEIKGAKQCTFRNVSFYATDQGWDGDIKIIGNSLYIQNVRIPVKSSLIGWFYNTFIQESQNEIVDIYFEIDDEGNYREYRKHSNNSADFWLGKILEFGSTPNWSSWYK